MEKHYCDKTYFATEKDAEEYIIKLKATSKRSVKPQRAYLCPHCNSWHLTSRDKNEYDVIMKLRAEINEKNKIITNLNKIIHEKNLKIKELRGGSIWEKINENL